MKYLDEIRNASLTLPAAGSANDSVWHLFPVLINGGSRDEFQAHLRSQGIATGVHYSRVIPDQPVLADAGLGDYSTQLETARRFARSEVSLPLHPFMTDAEVEAVIQACNNWNGS
jgi:dTDP-3-amino-3,4,6-trideoxy-alpha-D-glucose transaminase